MRVLRGLILFTLLVATTLPALADSDWSDSPTFSLNLLSPFAVGTYGVADSSSFSTNLLSIWRASADSETFSYNWLFGANPFAGAPAACAWPLDSAKLMELDASGNWQSIAQTPSPGSMLFVLNHGWNDGPENNTAQPGRGMSDLARAIHSQFPAAHIYMWHWGDGDSVRSDANPNGKPGLSDFAAVLNYLHGNPASPVSTLAAIFIGDVYFHDEINITWSNAAAHGKMLGAVMKQLQLTPINYDIHMIGHSFGGVVCAEAARVINSGSHKIKQLTTLDTPGLPWPYAVAAVRPDLAQRTETIYYFWATDLAGLGFGGPGYTAGNLLNLHLMPIHYPPVTISEGFNILHSRAVEWYIDSINGTANCTPNYYGFNWSFARDDLNPDWPSGLSTGMMAEKMDALGCVQPWLPQRALEGISKTAVAVKDGFESAAAWTGQQAVVVVNAIGQSFTSSLKITSMTAINLQPSAGQSVAVSESQSDETAGVYRQLQIPLNAQNLELSLRFDSVVEGHFLAVTVDGVNVLLVDPYVEGVSLSFRTYSADISVYAGKTVTLQIALQGTSEQQTVVLIDSLQFTQTTLGADVNEDGRVDVLDVIRMSDYWMGPVFAEGDDSDKADIDNNGRIDLADFAMLSDNWFWEKGGYIAGDLDHSGRVDMDDLATISAYWMTSCDIQTRCQNADHEPDGDVDIDDLLFFAEHWLDGAETVI